MTSLSSSCYFSAKYLCIVSLLYFPVNDTDDKKQSEKKEFLSIILIKADIRNPLRCLLKSVLRFLLRWQALRW